MEAARAAAVVLEQAFLPAVPPGSDKGISGVVRLSRAHDDGELRKVAECVAELEKNAKEARSVTMWSDRTATAQEATPERISASATVWLWHAETKTMSQCVPPARKSPASSSPVMRCTQACFFKTQKTQKIKKIEGLVLGYNFLTTISGLPRRRSDLAGYSAPVVSVVLCTRRI